MARTSESERQKYETAERALLDSEGVDASARFVDLDRLGGQLRVLEAGEGPPVLFVPGVMTGGAVFAGLVGRLPDYRCIMIDRPGVGLSPQLATPPKSRADHDLAGDNLLVDVLDGLGIERSHVVCTSMGGWSAFRSIAASPDRFDRMVGLAFLLGAGVDKLPLSMRMTPPFPALFPKRIPATPGLVKRMITSTGMRSVVESGKFSDELANWMAALLRHTEMFRNDSLYSPRPDWVHPADVMQRITLPVHLFWGDDDLFGQEAKAQSFADKLPNASLQLVRGAGHAPWLDEPDLAADAIRHHFTS